MLTLEKLEVLNLNRGPVRYVDWTIDEALESPDRDRLIYHIVRHLRDPSRLSPESIRKLKEAGHRGSLEVFRKLFPEHPIVL